MRSNAPLFVNCTHRLLVDDAGLLLPAPSVVLELTEHVPADEPGPIRDALRRAQGRSRALLDCVIAYEQGSGLRADSAAQAAAISMKVIPSAYGEAIQWVGRLAVDPRG